MALVRIGLLFGATLALASCGGLVNLTNGGNAGFVGTWVGSATGNSVTGSMTLTIDGAGNITGTDTISRPGNTTTDSGTVNASGGFNLTSSQAGTNVGTMSGQVTAIATQMTGTGAIVINGVSSSLSFTLTQN